MITTKQITNKISSLDNLYIGSRNFNDYIVIGQYSLYFSLLVYFLFELIFLHYPYTKIEGFQAFYETFFVMPFTSGTPINPILNRGVNYGGHEIAYLFILGLTFYARIKLPKTIEGFYYSILIPAFALSISEGFFNIYYYAYYYPLYPHITWDIFVLTNPLAVMYIAFISLGCVLTPITKFVSRKRSWIAFGLIQLYFIIWTIFGFPVTLSSIAYYIGLGLETQWINNIWINLVEIGQWIVASLSFIWVLRSIK